MRMTLDMTDSVWALEIESVPANHNVWATTSGLAAITISGVV